jgi:hypothetical protein
LGKTLIRGFTSAVLCDPGIVGLAGLAVDLVWVVTTAGVGLEPTAEILKQKKI